MNDERPLQSIQVPRGYHCSVQSRRPTRRLPMSCSLEPLSLGERIEAFFSAELLHTRLAELASIGSLEDPQANEFIRGPQKKTPIHSFELPQWFSCSDARRPMIPNHC